MSTGAHGTEEKKHGGINGFVLIGFFALVIAGMLLAIYASRYVPETLARLSAAVYLSGDKPENTATTTPPKNDEVFVPDVSEPTTDDTDTPELPDETGYTPPRTVTPTYTYTPPRPTGPQLYGSADLSLTNVEAGYVRSGRYIEDDTVPTNRDMYVRFTVRNSGTNIASGWRVLVEVEGERDAVASGGVLYPNGTQTFTLRVTNPEEGRNLTTKIDVDFQNAVNESNERNNDRSIDVDIDD